MANSGERLNCSAQAARTAGATCTTVTVLGLSLIHIYVINHVSLVDPAGDAFRKEYAEKYNGAKMELNGYMAHDAFLLWCRCV